MEARSQGSAGTRTVLLVPASISTGAPGMSLPCLRSPRGNGARTSIPPAVVHVSNEWLEVEDRTLWEMIYRRSTSFNTISAILRRDFPMGVDLPLDGGLVG